MVTTYPTNPKVTGPGNFSFMGAYTDPFQAGVVARFATQQLGASTAAVLTEIGDAYSEGVSKDFIKHFSAQGGTITIQQFYDTGTTDFTEQLTPIAAVDPAVDVVFLAGLGSEFPVAVKQAQSADFSILATFLGADGWDRPDLVEIGGMAVEGSFFVNHFSPGGDPERKKSQFSCRMLASGKSQTNVPRSSGLSDYLDSKKPIKSSPCAFAFTCLSCLIIFPALSMTTVMRLLMPSGWSVAPNSKLSERSVSTRSGKFRSYCSANFLWVSASCTLTPKTCTSCVANWLDSSRSEQTPAVQPLVKSLG